MLSQQAPPPPPELHHGAVGTVCNAYKERGPPWREADACDLPEQIDFLCDMKVLVAVEDVHKVCWLRHSHVLPVVSKPDGADGADAPPEGGQALVGAPVPQTHCLVLAPCGKDIAGRVPSSGERKVDVLSALSHALPCRHVHKKGLGGVANHACQLPIRSHSGVVDGPVEEHAVEKREACLHVRDPHRAVVVRDDCLQRSLGGLVEGDGVGDSILVGSDALAEQNLPAALLAPARRAEVSGDANADHVAVEPACQTRAAVDAHGTDLDAANGQLGPLEAQDRRQVVRHVRVVENVVAVRHEHVVWCSSPHQIPKLEVHDARLQPPLVVLKPVVLPLILDFVPCEFELERSGRDRPLFVVEILVVHVCAEARRTVLLASGVELSPGDALHVFSLEHILFRHARRPRHRLKVFVVGGVIGLVVRRKLVRRAARVHLHPP
mmetsp:Transcript_53076/g.124253  ORF Transcript_53076/g.124253 Transcript_53076/m.124253 type:complete len:437 (+) Transcript_53076:66-1376(+)